MSTITTIAFKKLTVLDKATPITLTTGPQPDIFMQVLRAAGRDYPCNSGAFIVDELARSAATPEKMMRAQIEPEDPEKDYITDQINAIFEEPPPRHFLSNLFNWFKRPRRSR